jgi:hypothetical protein
LAIRLRDALALFAAGMAQRMKPYRDSPKADIKPAGFKTSNP